MEQKPNMMTQIKENYSSFSKSHRRLADYILKNMHEAAFISINELSKKTQISPATITRFVRKLNFQGYPDFQRGIYEHQQEWAPFGALKSMIRNDELSEESALTPLQWTIQSNINLLEHLFTPQLEGAFNRSVAFLHGARRIYILGLRSSYPAAYYLAFMLQQMYDNVHLISPSTSDLPATLSNVSPEDCLVTLAYSRYTRLTNDIVCHFHNVGCKIVSITDSLTSPIALNSTEVLIAPNSGHYSPVSAITLCNCFITSLGRLDPQHTLERMELQDQIAMDHHIYL